MIAKAAKWSGEGPESVLCMHIFFYVIVSLFQLTAFHLWRLQRCQSSWRVATQKKERVRMVQPTPTLS